MTQSLPWLAFLIFLPLTARAEVNIIQEHRIRNFPEGRCGWCALETLARHHQIKSLYGLAQNHSSRARAKDLESALDKASVNYRVQDSGNRQTFILKYAVQEKLGAIVGFRGRTPDSSGHMVTLVGFSSQGVRVIDSNDADGRVRTMSLQRFLSWWDGFALVVEPDEDAN